MDLKQGFSRIEVGGEVRLIEDYLNERRTKKTRKTDNAPINVVVDRLTVRNDKTTISRLTDSTQTALYEGDGQCILKFMPDGEEHFFSMKFEADGIEFEEPNDQMFSFNSPAGACPECEGFGKIVGIDENLVMCVC